MKTSAILLAMFIALTANSQAWKDTYGPEQTTIITGQQAGFIPNKGQWQQEVIFLTSTQNMNAWITGAGVTFDFFRIEKKAKDLSPPGEARLPGQSMKTTRKGHVLKMNFATPPGSQPVFRPQEKAGTTYHYYLGNDPSCWAPNVPAYQELIVEGVFGKETGIDIRYYFEPRGLRYDFIVQPGASVEDISFTLEGADNVKVESKDELVISTSLGNIYHKGLVVYQEIGEVKREVPGRFSINERGEIGFSIQGENPAYPIVIDPLIYSTFLGGNITDQAYGFALGADGRVFVAGQTNSPNFPTTPGAYDEGFNNKRDVFVSVLSADLSELLYSTFIGGEEEDLVFALALDPYDQVYLSGQTSSEFYPVTAGAFDTTHNGSGDVFVSALSPDLSQLLHSTFLGGTASDVGYDLAVHPDGNIYVTGYSGSINYPTTAGAFQPNHSGIGSVIVSVLTPELDQLLHSTYLGGSQWWEIGRSMAFDSSGNVCITGETGSANFPVSPGAYDETHNGGTWDGFVSLLSQDLSELLHSTFIGGSHEDYGLSITLDAEDNIYVSGMTRSSDFPATEGAYETSFSAYRDAFVSVFSPDLGELLSASYIGGNTWDYANDIALNHQGNVYITGFTSSNDYPVTPGAFNEVFTGTRQVIVSVFDPDLGELLYSTFLGGSSFEEASRLLFDDDGNLYLAGWTFSSDFPTTPGAFNEWHNGGYDVFVSVFSQGFMPGYNLTLTASPEEGGTVSGEGVYAEGQQVEIAAMPVTAWLFMEWTGDVAFLDDPGSATATVTMPAEDIALTANFELAHYPLTLEAYPEEGGAVEGEGEYPAGTEVEVSAQAASGWDFVRWTDEEGIVVSEEASFTFNMPAEEVTLIAVFDFTDQVDELTAGPPRVFPNPANHLLYVESDQRITRLELLEMRGRPVRSIQVNALNAELSVRKLPEGVYLLRIHTGDEVYTEVVTIIQD